MVSLVSSIINQSFAAAAAAAAAAECNMKNYLGREDTLNGIVGGAAVGAVLGLKTNSGANALKYGALFAGEPARACGSKHGSGLGFRV
jgi:hypothetical protein